MINFFEDIQNRRPIKVTPSNYVTLITLRVTLIAPGVSLGVTLITPGVTLIDLSKLPQA